MTEIITSPTEQEAYEYCVDTINQKNALERSYLVLCRRLHTIKLHRLYEANFDNWEVFLEELRIDKGSAERMIRIYQRFILELDISPEKIETAGGWSVVAELLPIAKDKETAEEALVFASMSRKKDVRMYVNEKLGKVPAGICSHENTYTVCICRDCHDRWQEHE